VTAAHNSEMVLSEDGKLVLENLPFRAGQKVRVLVFSSEENLWRDESMRGMLLRYDDPTESAVPEDDWNVLRGD